MAIPQEEFIHIVSQNVGDRSAAERDLSGLVFTTTDTLSTTPEGVKWDAEYDQIPVYSSVETENIFGSLSKEADFARNYFGYISPSSTTPRKLTFCRLSAQTAPATAIANVDEMDSNFGSCAFLQSDNYTVAQMTSAMVKIKELNYKYLLSVSIGSGYVTGEGADGTDRSTVADANSQLGQITAAAFANYCADNGFSGQGVFLIKSAIEGNAGNEEVIYASLDAFMPLSLFASTDYRAVNGTKNYMFKQFDAVAPAVSTKTEKKSLDKLNVNYVGLVQNYGRMRKFLQQGVNLDGEDTAVYCNEIWLKSRISSELFNMLLSVEKISADQDGEDLIYNAICTCAEEAKVNGTIEPLKTLTDAQKRTIFVLSDDASAWETVYNSGYWLDVIIRQVQVDARTEYWAYYTLIYSKGDSIRKVEGKDFLV